MAKYLVLQELGGTFEKEGIGATSASAVWPIVEARNRTAALEQVELLPDSVIDIYTVTEVATMRVRQVTTTVVEQVSRQDPPKVSVARSFYYYGQIKGSVQPDADLIEADKRSAQRSAARARKRLARLDP